MVASAYCETISSYPRDIAAYNNLGIVLAEQGRYFRLAGLYNRIGERSKAAAEAAEVKRLKDENREADTLHDVTH